MPKMQVFNNSYPLLLLLLLSLSSHLATPLPIFSGIPDLSYPINSPFLYSYPTRKLAVNNLPTNHHQATSSSSVSLTFPRTYQNILSTVRSCLTLYFNLEQNRLSSQSPPKPGLYKTCHNGKDKEWKVRYEMPSALLHCSQITKSYEHSDFNNLSCQPNSVKPHMSDDESNLVVIIVLLFLFACICVVVDDKSRERQALHALEVWQASTLHFR